jgi:diacylglycerol kinase family enzyme
MMWRKFLSPSSEYKSGNRFHRKFCARLLEPKSSAVITFSSISSSNATRLKLKYDDSTKNEGRVMIMEDNDFKFEGPHSVII